MTDNLQPNDRGVQLKLLSRKMVHNLNNALFLVGGYVELIKQDQTDTVLLDNIKQIEAALDQNQHIMRDWRTAADQIVPDPENVD